MAPLYLYSSNKTVTTELTDVWNVYSAMSSMYDGCS